MSRNSVHIDITGNNIDLKNKLNDVRRDLKATSTEAQKQSNAISSALKRISATIGVGFGVSQVKGFVAELINVRSEIQSVEKSLEVLAGRQIGKRLADDIKKFAVETPMGFQELAKGAQTMLAFNISGEKVMPMLRAMGDISMGNADKFQSLVLAFSQMSSTGKLMGQDLLQMINAGFNPLAVISEQTGKSIGQLKEEMADGAISADTITQAFIDATSAGGKFCGMLQQQSEGIAGVRSNLEGAYEEMLNQLGEDMQEVIIAAMKGVTELLQNYEKMGKTIMELVAVYGSYKAIVITLSAIEKVRYQMTLAQMAGYTKMGAIMDILNTKQKALNATLAKNPYMLIAAAVTALGVAVYKLATAQTDAEKSQKRLTDANNAYIKETTKERLEIDRLFARLKAAKEGTEEYNTVKNEIISKYGTYLEGLSKEITSLEDVKGAYDAITTAAQNAAKARALEKATTEAYDVYATKEADAKEDVYNALNKKFGDKKGADGVSLAETYYWKIVPVLEGKEQITEEVQGIIDQLDERHNVLEAIISSATGQATTIVSNKIEDAILAAGKARNLLNSEIASAERLFGGATTTATTLDDSTTSETTTTVVPTEEDLKEAEKAAERLAKIMSDLNIENNSLQFDLDITKLKDELEITTDLTRQLEIQEEIRERMRDQELASIDREENEAIIEANKSGKSVTEVVDKFDEKRKIVNDKYNYEAEHVDTATKLKAYEEYAQKVIDIETWKEDKIAEISATNLSDEEKQNQIALVEEKADFDIEQAGAMLGEDAATMGAELSGIIESVMAHGMETLMQQIPILQAELQRLKKNGGNVNEIAKIETKLATATRELTRKTNNLGKESADTADKTENKWEKAGKAISAVGDVCDTIADSFGDMLSEAGTDALNTAQTVATTMTSMISLISTTAWTGAEAVKGVEKASVILTIISMAIQVIMAIVNVMTKYFSKNAQIQKQIDESQARIDGLQKKYEDLERAMKKALGTDYYQSMIEQVKVLTEQQEEYNHQLALAQEQIDSAATNKKREKAEQQYAEIEDSQTEGLDKIDDIMQTFYDELIGQDLKGFSEELAESIVEGFETGMDDIGSVMDDAMDELMKGMLKKQIALMLETQLKGTFDKIQAAFGDNDQTLSQAEIDAIQAQYEADKRIAEEKAEAYRELMAQMGLTDDADIEAESKGFDAMSQDTGDELNGRFTAFQISAANIDEKVGEIKVINHEMLKLTTEMQEYVVMVAGIAENQLLELRNIVANTAMLKETNEYLNKIKEYTSRL